MKLTKSQQAVLDCLKIGYQVTFIRSFKGESYYFRQDNGGRCSREVSRLLALGLVRKVDNTHGGHTIALASIDP